MVDEIVAVASFHAERHSVDRSLRVGRDADDAVPFDIQVKLAPDTAVTTGGRDFPFGPSKVLSHPVRQRTGGAIRRASPARLATGFQHGHVGSRDQLRRSPAFGNAPDKTALNLITGPHAASAKYALVEIDPAQTDSDRHRRENAVRCQPTRGVSLRSGRPNARIRFVPGPAWPSPRRNSRRGASPKWLCVPRPAKAFPCEQHALGDRMRAAGNGAAVTCDLHEAEPARTNRRQIPVIAERGNLDALRCRGFKDRFPSAASIFCSSMMSFMGQSSRVVRTLRENFPGRTEGQGGRDSQPAKRGVPQVPGQSTRAGPDVGRTGLPGDQNVQMCAPLPPFRFGRACISHTTRKRRSASIP